MREVQYNPTLIEKSEETYSPTSNTAAISIKVKTRWETEELTHKRDMLDLGAWHLRTSIGSSPATFPQLSRDGISPGVQSSQYSSRKYTDPGTGTLCTDQQSHQIKMRKIPRGSIVDRTDYSTNMSRVSCLM
jgi:hypothetical protein